MYTLVNYSSSDMHFFDHLGCLVFMNACSSVVQTVIIGVWVVNIEFLFSSLEYNFRTIYDV